MNKVIGSSIVVIVLLLVVALVVYWLWKDKKNGKSSCGSSCGCCPNAQLCHAQKRKPSDSKSVS